jgi:sugar-specific transcriptional regulator TrmB
MDTEVLEDLGLTQAEIKTYIALLELGTSSAGKIIERSGLQNSVIHRSLNSLIEKGLATFILEGRKKIYQATDPENFHEFIDDKKKMFDTILPELKLKQKFSKETTFARVYKGKRGINEMYNFLINVKGNEYNTFGGGTRVTHESMGDSWWTNLHRKMVAKKLKRRQIFDETIRNFGTMLSRLPYSDIRYLSKEFEQLQETIIIGEYIGIAIFTSEPYGVLIKDKEVADGYRKQFEMLWKLAKK